MKTGVVNSALFHSDGYRIDPDMHLGEGVQIRRELHATPYELSTIGENASRVFYGNIFSRVFVKKPDHGVPYLAASDTVLSNLDTGYYLSKKQAAQLSNLMLKKDWILVTCSGTLGNVTYTNKVFEKYIATHDLIRVVPNDAKVNKGTLHAFLSSRYGYYQITQSQFGGVVKHVNDDQMKQVMVPVFPSTFQQEVDDLIQQSAKHREQAADALEKAKKAVSSFINVHFEKEHFKTAKVSSKEILNSLQYRLDPPALIFDGVKTMEEMTNRVPFKKVGDLNAKVYRPGIFKRIYVAKGIPYIKGSEIFLTNPFRRCEQLSRSRTPFIDEMTLREGQILMTCAGSVGDVKIITKEYEDKKAIGSQDIIRIESYDELYTREYLFVYFQVPFVYDYIQSMKYGSVIERIEPFHVESIPVIKPSKELSDEVTAIIKTYMDYTYRAFNAEEKAITMVEEEIEKWQSPTA